ncbi:diguanylate cyclase [Aquibaculum sediminis]|uniref:diguanylate cyclase n=1 Tax=Aquibaculum sediminis TaxID=3231907 RepID=UPI003452D01E
MADPLSDRLDEACSREPIHRPDAIQPYGLLTLVDRKSDRIELVAGDFKGLLGQALSGAGVTLADLAGETLESLIESSGEPLSHIPVFLTTLDDGPRGPLVLLAHSLDAGARVVVEFIPDKHRGDDPDGREHSTPRMLSRLRSTIERIASAESLEQAFESTTQAISRITGYDRILLYRFLEDGTGTVVAESKAAELSTYLNHRYPASEIPRQARELYRTSSFRLIPDVNYRPAPLRALSGDDRPSLDMSHSLLRSVAPVHLQYLRNMGVGASMSLSLLVDGELWGLIACHNSTARVIPYETQEECRHIAELLSRQIESRQREAEFARKAQMDAASNDLLRSIVAMDQDEYALLGRGAELLDVVPAHGVAVTYQDKVAAYGTSPGEAAVLHLRDALAAKLGDEGFYATDCLTSDLPAARAYAPRAGGVLAIRLSVNTRSQIFWFLAEQIEEISWAGNPHETDFLDEKTGKLNLRASFAVWRETVRDRSRPWLAAELAAARSFQESAAFVFQSRYVADLNESLRLANQELADLASTDGLTGLANRRIFQERLRSEWARALREEAPLSLVMLDIDYFKRYNDHYGHPAGDQCLATVAQAIDGIAKRPADLAARTGGEEFAVILPATDLQGAEAIAEQLRQRITGLQLPHSLNPEGVVTVSLGVATTRPHSSDAETRHRLVLAADVALYDAKNSGRNRVCVNEL